MENGFWRFQLRDPASILHNPVREEFVASLRQLLSQAVSPQSVQSLVPERSTPATRSV